MVIAVPWDIAQGGMKPRLQLVCSSIRLTCPGHRRQGLAPRFKRRDSPLSFLHKFVAQFASQEFAAGVARQRLVEERNIARQLVARDMLGHFVAK